MYAIALDLDAGALEEHCGNAANAYGEVEHALAMHGFTWRQGSIYFGVEARVNAVSTVVAVQEIAKEFPWFSRVVRYIRMLRIEENSDLSLAVGGGPMPLESVFWEDRATLRATQKR